MDQANIRRAYDLAAERYAEKFLHELDHKPFDRGLLLEFANLVGPAARILDLGCGPGHTTSHLTTLGLQATGVDLSPQMIDVAAAIFPLSRFAVGDFFALPNESNSIAGLLAFYCIVHLTPTELPRLFAELHRVLQPGGVLLLSFHAGTEVIRAEKFLGTAATLDFRFFEPEQVRDALSSAGFEAIDIRVREPYATEYPSLRCYVFAHKPG